MSYMKEFTKGLLKENPTLVSLLGMCPTLATTTSVTNALGMGAAVILSMLLSSIVISALHKIIPAYAKLPAYLLIITGFVSLIEMIMEAFFPIVVDMLGAHLAALAVSAVIYRDAEEVADHNGEWHSIKTALSTGLFLTVIMVICALIREILGNASFWGKEIAFLANYKVSALAGAFGAYIVLACVLAAIKKLTGAEEHLEGEEHE